MPVDSNYKYAKPFGCFQGQSARESYLNIGGYDPNCRNKLPPSGHSLAPWCYVKFCLSLDQSDCDDGETITVGNWSSPGSAYPNVAVISEFEFGHSDGVSVRVVIHDQQGGAFEEFFKHLFKDWNKITAGNARGNMMRFQFGWARTGCATPVPDAASPCYFALITGMETSYTQGKFIAEITAKDIPAKMFEGHAEYTWESCLEDAIRELLTNSEPPNVGNVKFVKHEDGKDVECGFEPTGDERCQKDSQDGLRKLSKGPWGQHHAASQDKLHIVRRWLRDHPTENGKGWIVCYNPETIDGEIIIREDSRPDCDGAEPGFFAENCIGTYVVNGSNLSPVLEFNPQIQWNFATLDAGGGNTSSQTLVPHPDTKDGAKSPGRRDCQTLTRDSQPGAGHPKFITDTQLAKDLWNMDSIDKLQRARAKDAMANEDLLTFVPMRADLVLVGDPHMVRPLEARAGKYVELLVINPYFLFPSGKQDATCPVWMAEPLLNKVLSNRGWRVMGCTHKIVAGRYTTTLDVMLSLGGSQMNEGAPTGGDKAGYNKKS